jgi:uncharacterized protein YunC (DUF1805 family)
VIIVENQLIEIENGDVIGLKVELSNAPLILLKVKRGYIMCGYLNMDVANTLGDIAGKVTGVKTFDDALKATVVEVSDKAKKKGLKVGITGRTFLNRLLER